MKFMFTGGGTLGPVTPLLAVIVELRRRLPEAEFVFVGTKDGPERKLVDDLGVEFLSIKAPKFRRYFSLNNLTLPFRLIASLAAARRILKRERPDIVVGAGGYTSVPLGWAAKTLGIKLLIHQQDVLPSLSNRMLASAANAITVTFEKSLKDFPSSKTTLTGNPVRPRFEAVDPARSRKLLKLSGERPVVLAVGGGTGSAFLNEAIALATPLWTDFADLVHITGFNRDPIRLPPKLIHPERYHQKDFVGEDIVHYFAAADAVITRAGLGTLTELGALSKPIVIIPIPDSHQEINASYIAEHGGGMVMRELDLTPEQLVTFTKSMLLNQPKRAESLGKNLNQIFKAGAREMVAKKVLELVSEKA